MSINPIPISKANATVSSAQTIIDEAASGRMVILVDDEDRENEGDIVIPAQFATSEVINFMARHARGLICLSLTTSRIQEMGIPMMARSSHSRFDTAFTASIEAREGVTTGISAADRAHTIAVAIDPLSKPQDLVTPGHVFPLAAREGGTLVRPGHTEAAVDLARLAGLNPSGVICEIMNDDGSMARLPELLAFAERFNIKVGTIADLISYRRKTDRLIKRAAASSLHHPVFGEWEIIVFRNEVDSVEHMALLKNVELPTRAAVPVSFHFASIYNDFLLCSGRGPLDDSMEKTMLQGGGVIIVLNENGSSEISRQIAASSPHRRRSSLDRDHSSGAQILADLGITQVHNSNLDHESAMVLQRWGLTG